MVSTGMAAQIGGSFADDAGLASFCAAASLPVPAAGAETTTVAPVTTTAAPVTTTVAPAAGGSTELSGAGGLGVAVAFAALAARVVV
mmetsp:Transcript_93147/g.249457  ORF Transcript_93147/g.249457 Transcript_93147/m.249457 type:complete len:87 (-) Transcript_93147:313-573(-)